MRGSAWFCVETLHHIRGSWVQAPPALRDTGDFRRFNYPPEVPGHHLVITKSVDSSGLLLVVRILPSRFSPGDPSDPHSQRPFVVGLSVLVHPVQKYLRLCPGGRLSVYRPELGELDPDVRLAPIRGMRDPSSGCAAA